MKAVAAIAAGMITIAAAGLCSCSPPARIQTRETIHPHAPAFSLVDLQGKTVRLSDYQEKVVLLDFWATWCVPCKTEIPRFVEWQKKYAERGFQVIGISMDDRPEPVREFYGTFKLNYPVVIANEKVARAYGGILGLPVNFLIGRDGRIHSTHTGETDLASMQQEIELLIKAE